MLRAAVTGALLLGSSAHAFNNAANMFARDVCIPTTVQVTITTTVFQDMTATEWHGTYTSANAQAGSYGKPGDSSPKAGAGHG